MSQSLLDEVLFPTKIKSLNKEIKKESQSLLDEVLFPTTQVLTELFALVSQSLLDEVLFPTSKKFKALEEIKKSQSLLDEVLFPTNPLIFFFIFQYVTRRVVQIFLKFFITDHSSKH